jgi:hypothetical protein
MEADGPLVGPLGLGQWVTPKAAEETSDAVLSIDAPGEGEFTVEFVLSDPDGAELAHGSYGPFRVFNRPRVPITLAANKRGVVP